MHATREDYREFHRRRHALLADLLVRHAPHEGQRCLDVGGGGDIAGVSDVLRARFAELHAVEQGADVAEGRRAGVEAVAVDIDREPLPYPDTHFGLVLFASVIEHLYNPRHVLDEITRVLRPAGVLLLEAPNAVALGRRLDALAGRNPFRWFNRFNALEGQAPMVLCSVFYTAEEVEMLLGDRYAVLERRYAMHSPPAGPAKAALRELAYRLNPRLGDCFAVVAQKRCQVPGTDC